MHCNAAYAYGYGPGPAEGSGAARHHGKGRHGHTGAHGMRPGFDLAMMWRAMTEGHERAEGPGRGRHGPRGGWDPRGFPFGPGGFGGPGFGFGRHGGFRRGPKARRGDVRTAALLLLAEEPRNGYQIMQELEQRSGGAWRPSPGSVYPALQQLEDEGLIRSEQSDGRKLFHLTDAGRRYVADRGTDKPAPWDEMAGDIGDDVRALMESLREVALALTQVSRTGSDAQRAEARRILVGARRDLYRLLAEGDPDELAGEPDAPRGPDAGGEDDAA